MRQFLQDFQINTKHRYRGLISLWNTCATSTLFRLKLGAFQSRVRWMRFEEQKVLYKRWTEVLARPDAFYLLHLAATESMLVEDGCASACRIRGG